MEEGRSVRRSVRPLGHNNASFLMLLFSYAGTKKDTFGRMVKGENVSDLQPQLFTGGVLREYQIKGYTWMKSLFENGINGKPLRL